jgi:endo-1,4-beta-xylanase
MRPAHVFALLLAASAGLVFAADDKPKPAADLPEIKELPNPFVFNDGTPVRTADDWTKRRDEIKNLFQDYEYGHLPPKPKMTVTRGEVATDADAKISTQELTLKLEHEGNSIQLKVRVAWPSEAKEAVPVVLQPSFGFGGKGPPPAKAFANFTKRGYAVAQFSLNDAAPDGKGRTTGVYKLYGDKIDCGTLMAWGWCFHRVLDALEEVKEIDAKKAVVTGHSRYGKAALVAGAFDDRIALTVPSHSGCGGSAPYRLIYAKNEELKNIVGAFPFWFRPDFNQFADKVTRLPVDQHMLISLVAPRALLQPEGTQDTWTNPEGVQQTYAAARKVYEFLKAGDKIAIRYRPVGHIPSSEDLLDYADHVFFKKALPEAFGKLEYKPDPKAFSWDVPK